MAFTRRGLETRGLCAVKVNVEEVLGVVLLDRRGAGAARGAGEGGGGCGCGDGVLAGVLGCFFDGGGLEGRGAA